VIGYEANTRRSNPAHRAPAMRPHVSVSVPVTVRYTPGDCAARAIAKAGSGSSTSTVSPKA